MYWRVTVGQNRVMGTSSGTQPQKKGKQGGALIVGMGADRRLWGSFTRARPRKYISSVSSASERPVTFQAEVSKGMTLARQVAQ
jgi:hypothetical protein